MLTFSGSLKIFVAVVYDEKAATSSPLLQRSEHKFPGTIIEVREWFVSEVDVGLLA